MRKTAAVLSLGIVIGWLVVVLLYGDASHRAPARREGAAKTSATQHAADAPTGSAGREGAHDRTEDRRSAGQLDRKRPRARVLGVRDAANGAIILVVGIGRLQNVKPGDRLQLTRGGDLVGFADAPLLVSLTAMITGP